MWDFSLDMGAKLIYCGLSCYKNAPQVQIDKLREAELELLNPTKRPKKKVPDAI